MKQLTEEDLNRALCKVVINVNYNCVSERVQVHVFTFDFCSPRKQLTLAQWT